MSNTTTLPLIHFAHANGFVAECYLPFLEALHPYSTQFVSRLAHDERFPINLGWWNIAKELIHHIEAKNQGQKVVGLGHSMGAVAMLWASILRPDLFEQVVIMDPPLMDRKRRFFQALAHYGRITKYVHPVGKKAYARRRYFPSKAAAHDYFNGKSFFRHFDRRSFELYIEKGVIETQDPAPEKRFGLYYTAENEYRIFDSAPILFPKAVFKVPTHLICADAKDVLNDASLAQLQKHYNWSSFQLAAGRHLFPLESPQVSAELVKSILAS